MDFFVLNLKTLKEAFAYTYEDLMPLFGKSRATIINYLAGKTRPSRGKMEDFAKHVGVTYEVLTGREISWEEAKALAGNREPGTPAGTEFSSILKDDGGGYVYGAAKSSDEGFDISLALHTGRVISSILDKHRTPREYYAKQVLKRDPTTLQRICRGEIMAGFEIILRVALDHNEPLELFRTGPLPQGHLLAQLRDKETIIDTQRELISVLQKQPS